MSTVAAQLTYEKAPQHQVIRTDGAWATITPTGNVQLAVFSELAPLPDPKVVELLANDMISAEIDPPEIIREVQATLVMHPEVASRVVSLLEYVLEKAAAK